MNVFSQQLKPGLKTVAKFVEIRLPPNPEVIFFD